MPKAKMPSEAAKFLRRFRWALSELPQADRDDILAEVSAHIEERTCNGADIGDIIAGFGPPEIYARSFLSEHDETVAIATGRLTNLMPALAARATKSISALVAFVVLGVLWMCASLLAVLAVMKIFNPRQIGLWRSETEFFLGFQDSPATASELLGIWIFPLTFGALIGAAFLSRWAALNILKNNA